jgi:threonine dehydratase
VIQSLVEEILVVSEDEIRDAMRSLMRHAKVVAEPSGAVAVAAILAGKIPGEGQRIGAVISGGNVDLEFLKTL